MQRAHQRARKTFARLLLLFSCLQPAAFYIVVSPENVSERRRLLPPTLQTADHLGRATVIAHCQDTFKHRVLAGAVVTMFAMIALATSIQQALRLGVVYLSHRYVVI